MASRCERIQGPEGYVYDAGPGMIPPQGGLNSVPAGSRLHQYLGANRQVMGNAFGNNGGNTSGSNLRVHAPVFVPKHKFQQMTISENPQQQQQQQHIPQPQPPQFNRPFAGNHPSNPQFEMQPSRQYSQQLHESHGGTMYFYHPDSNSDETNYEHEMPLVVPEGHTVVNTNGCFAYQGPLPHIGKFRPKGTVGNNQAQFINPDLKIELVNRQLAIDTRADANVYPDIPAQIDHLNSLVPLENVTMQHLTQTTYKAISVRDGVAYCVRRIHGFRQQNQKQLAPLESWKKLVHVNVVQLREVITHCVAFGDNYSLVLVYDYHPLAESLKSRHFGQATGAFFDGISGAKINSGHQQSPHGAGVSESTLWSYVIQLSAALRAIHASGLAARNIDLTKVLIHGKQKLLLSFCGVQDIVSPTENQTLQKQLQLEDMLALGRLLVALATGNAFGARRDLISQSLQYIQAHFSVDMKNLINYLLTPGNGQQRKSINDIMPMIGARFYAQVENLQQRSDYLESELSKELENGRLFRVLAKINTILERNEMLSHNRDENWSETGDRFMIKLFRDYVFHQVMENGKPWLDMAHIVQCLNKLDSGVPEKIELVSRDGENLIIVSYGDLKRCMESSFRDLCGSNVAQRH